MVCALSWVTMKCTVACWWAFYPSLCLYTPLPFLHHSQLWVSCYVIEALSAQRIILPTLLLHSPTCCKLSIFHPMGLSNDNVSWVHSRLRPDWPQHSVLQSWDVQVAVFDRSLSPLHLILIRGFFGLIWTFPFTFQHDDMIRNLAICVHWFFSSNSTDCQCEV